MFAKFGKSKMLSPLRGRAFRRVFAGSGLAMLADQMFFIALTLLVLDVAGPGLQLGSVLAVAAVPGAALMLFGGWVSDRVSPVLVLVFSNAGRAILTGILAAIVVSDSVALWHLYALAGFLGVLDAFHYPASLSVVPKVVKKESLAPANALVQGAEQFGGLVGPALAAAAVAFVGLGATFGAFALMFLATSLVVASAVRVPPEFSGGDGTEGPLAVSGSKEGARSSGGIVEGLKYVWRDPVIRMIMVLFTAMSFAAIGPILVGGAALASERLGGAASLGILLSAFGGGSLAGLAVSSFGMPSSGRRGLVMLAVMGVFGVFLGSIGFASGIVSASILAAGAGAALGYLGVVMVTWLQERADDAFTGRVMSLVMLAAVALDPASYAFAGFLTALGMEVLFASAGAVVILAVIAGASSRELRKF
ncbi:MAG: MFS transporter [Rubrobacter sp.]|jgi:MFS family permease|nr:MFS transporter [Rubrobacter sp.]